MTPIYAQSYIPTQNIEDGLILTNEGIDSFQLFRWHVPTGKRQQLSNWDSLVQNVLVMANGRYIYYLQDVGGDEHGHIFRIPYAGGEPVNMTPDLTPFTLRGFYLSADGTTLSFNAVDKEGFHLYVVDVAEDGSWHNQQLVHESRAEFWQGMLSSDGALTAVISTHRTQSRKYSTVIFDTASGEQIAELWDGPEASVQGLSFHPTDKRLLGMTTQTGFRRPFIWHPLTNERLDLPLPEIDGDVIPVDWHPDGERILLSAIDKAIQTFFYYHLPSQTITLLDTPSGSYGFGAGEYGQVAYFLPNGDFVSHWNSSVNPTQVIQLDGETGQLKKVLLGGEADVPNGRSWQSITFPSHDGTTVQAWIASPDGDGPFPLMLDVHGGPHMVTTESFDPFSQSWLDHGVAYMSVNYRGSTTFGRTFREEIWGNLGHKEVDDMAAARQWAINQGIAHPEQVFVTGGSYGGYLTLMALATKPELWCGGIALVAMADLLIDYEDSSEALRSAKRNWMLGTPEEKPEAYRRSSPITYAEQIQAPLLIIQGENDTRCTPRQMQHFEEKLNSLGKQVEVVWFNAGHGVMNMSQVIGFQEKSLAFAYQVLQNNS